MSSDEIAKLILMLRSLKIVPHSGGTCGPTFTKDSTVDDLKIESIEIKIKSAPTTIGMIEALAHEMVHAKQYIKGDIGIGAEVRYFLGFIPYIKAKKLWKGTDVTDSPYYEQPSEIEAFLLQKQMTYDYLKLIEKNIDPVTMATLLNVK